MVNPYTVKLKLNKFEHVGEGWGLAHEGMGTCVGLGPCVGEGWGGLGLDPVQTPLRGHTDVTENIIFPQLC